MFCPQCGKSEQQVNRFCRGCGMFLPDFEKIEIKAISPQQHFSANTILSIMTAVVSLTLAITLYVMFLGRDDTQIVIYLTAGFLTAIFFWQAQVIWRTLQLKKQFPGLNRKKEKTSVEKTPFFEATKTKNLLHEADVISVVPQSITESSTKKLGEKIYRKQS